MILKLKETIIEMSYFSVDSSKKRFVVLLMYEIISKSIKSNLFDTHAY
jgi:hypothetical protein